ncbi:MAG: hypothetical protein HYV35_02505 [Lentisphaerae bacterium]|nr:hypothetical protein [Lentisphaerota bacterium]
MRNVLKSGRQRRQLFHVAAAVTPWPPEESTPSRARLQVGNDKQRLHALSFPPRVKARGKLQRESRICIASRFLLAGLLAQPLPMLAAPTPDYDANVLEITVTYQDFDPHIPWRKKAAQVRQGFGVVIAPGQVLTTEDLVRNHTQVELRRAKSGSKLAAAVREADDQLNTAILTFIPPQTGFTNLPGANAPVPLALADIIRRDDRLTIVKLEHSGEFQTSEAQVVELSASAALRPLALKVLTQLSIEQHGTPAFIDGRLAGLSVDYDPKTQTGLFIPCTTLSRFLADANAPPYKGMAWAGFQFEPLMDPVKRRFLGVPQEQGGILVTKTSPGSGAATVLQAGDVITAWDGVAVDTQGYYADQDFGRLRLPYLIGGRRAPGERVPVEFVRAQKTIRTEVLLKRQRDAEELIPEQATLAGPGQADAPVEYLVEGGLVLQELTGEYLRAAGENWQLKMNPRLVYYYLHQDKIMEKPGDHVVVLSMVLPDSINIGYQEFRDQVVTAVNGLGVRNMADVFRLVDASGGLRSISLLGYGVDLALDETALAEANRRIAAQYRIPRLRYQKIRKITIVGAPHRWRDWSYNYLGISRLLGFGSGEKNKRKTQTANSSKSRWAPSAAHSLLAG